MRASELPFERYMSERILYFAYLMCTSVSAPKALKNLTWLRFAIFNCSEKLRNIFEVGLKIWSVRTKIDFIEKKYFERKNSETRFGCLCVNLSTVEIWGQTDKFPTSFSFLQCPLRVKKNWFEKTALNMSIRRVIFTSG